jgi:hypothetical protein
MENKLTKLSLIAGVLATSLLGSLNANAACFASAQQVERVLSYGTYGYIYLRPAGALTNSFYYYVRTDSDKILSTAANAQTDSSRVNVYGDAASCPTAGTGRYMGNATYVYMLE